LLAKTLLFYLLPGLIGFFFWFETFAEAPLGDLVGVLTFRGDNLELMLGEKLRFFALGACLIISCLSKDTLFVTVFTPVCGLVLLAAGAGLC